MNFLKITRVFFFLSYSNETSDAKSPPVIKNLFSETTESVRDKFNPRPQKFVGNKSLLIWSQSAIEGGRIITWAYWADISV